MLSLTCSAVLPAEVCWGYIESSATTVVDSITGFILSPNYICEEVTFACSNREFTQMDPNDFISKVLTDKPKHLEDDMFVTNLHRKVASSNEERKTIKMAHFTDLHIDL